MRRLAQMVLAPIHFMARAVIMVAVMPLVAPAIVLLRRAVVAILRMVRCHMAPTRRSHMLVVLVVLVKLAVLVRPSHMVVLHVLALLAVLIMLVLLREGEWRAGQKCQRRDGQR